MTNNLSERLLSKIYISETNCWVYTAGKDSWGYGVIFANGKTIGAHRASWIAHKGDIPNGVHVLHICDNRACINPNHLFLGTHQDNMKDRDKKGNHYPGLTVLSVQDVIEIKSLLLDEKLTQVEIGRRYKVTKHAINDIKQGRTWKHV